MKNTFGNNIAVTLFGESHGEAVGAVLDGVPAGIEVDYGAIASALEKRRGETPLSTKRREADEFKIISGVYNGKTTGTPLCILIENTDTDSAAYEALAGKVRPGHADYTSLVKSSGFADVRGGGHLSGRLTAPLVAVGEICRTILLNKGIKIITHLAYCGGVNDRTFADFDADCDSLLHNAFPVLDEKAAEQMKTAILSAAEKGDSIGGITETCVCGLPAGAGEPWFDSVESLISHAMFSVPAVKGVEFGAGFKCADMHGSEMNDELYFESGIVKTAANNNGGINGGITNGMPAVFRCAVKPTPSVSVEQNTVDLKNNENTKIQVGGRHDPCIAPRACAVIDALTAITLCDLLAQKFGTDRLGE